MNGTTLCVLITSAILGNGIVNAKEDYKTPRYYVLNLTQTTWSEAQTNCRQSGGNLATLYDLSTIPDLYYSHVMERTDGLFWIGLHVSDDGWLWDSEEPFSWSNWNKTLSDSGCVAASVHKPYSWFPEHCRQPRPYMCQYQADECRFVEFPDRSIAAHNYLYVYQKSVEECKEMCTSSTTFICQSFEYNPDGGRCQFNSGNMWTLVQYYAVHEGWTYYHRTCNSGNVTGQLMDLTSTIISPTPTVPQVISIECSERFLTKDVFVTHSVIRSQIVPVSTTIPFTKSIFVTRDVTVTQNVYVTQDVPVSRDVFVTKQIPVYQDVNVTHDVMVTQTVNSTVTVTEFMTLTSTVIITPSPVFEMPSLSVLEDPVEEELKEISDAVKERHKNLKKISIRDDRPSATYVGYVAIAFLSAVFGSIILFDMLTIFKDTSICNKKKKPNRCINHIEDFTDSSCDSASKSLQYRLENRRKLLDTADDTGIETVAECHNMDAPQEDSAKDCLEIADDDDGVGSRRSRRRLWQYKNWSMCDSGFDGSGNTSEATGSENNASHFSHDSLKESVSETVHVSIERNESEIEDSLGKQDNGIDGEIELIASVNVHCGQDAVYNSDLNVNESIEMADSVTHL